MELTRTEHGLRPQEAFNKIWNHFVVEKNPPSVDIGQVCAYRGARGAKCAIGVLIADEFYQHAMEGMPLRNFPDKFPKVWKRLGLSLIQAVELQQCHDHAAFNDCVLSPHFHGEIERRLSLFAIDNKLEIPAGVTC